MKTVLYQTCLLIVCLLFWVNGYAQSDSLKIDSLKKALLTEKEDTNKVNTLNELCRAYYQNNDNENVLRTAKYMLALSSKIKFKSGQADAFYNIGLSYEDRPEELQYYTKALNLYKETGNKQAVIICYNNIEYIYIHLNNYAEALKNAYAGMKIREETGDKKNIADGFQSIASIFDFLKNDDDALKNYEAALRIYKVRNDELKVAQCFLSIGFIYNSKGDLQEALKNVSNAVKIFEQNKEKSGMGLAASYAAFSMIYENQGNLASMKGNNQLAKGKFTEALKNILVSLNLYKSFDYKPSVAQATLGVGKIYIKLLNLSEAKKHLEKSLEIFQSLRINSGLMEN